MTPPTRPLRSANLTRSTPSFDRAQQGIPEELQQVWGRLPTLAVEGHEPEKAWDVRSSGLAGRMARTRYELFPSNSGLSGVLPSDVTQNLVRLGQLIKDGKADWTAAKNYAEAARGDIFAGLLRSAQNAADNGDIPTARRKIVNLYWEVIPWRQQAAAANIGGTSQTTAAGVQEAWAREGLDPIDTITATLTQGPLMSSIQGAVSGLPSWALPAAAGMVVMLLLRR